MTDGIPCSFAGCTGLAKSQNIRLCEAHYAQQRKGKVLQPRRQDREQRPCSAPGCAEPYSARGLCARHYRQWAKGRPLTTLGPKREQFVPNLSLSPLGRLMERAEYQPSPPYLDTPCLVWTGPGNRRGYGHIYIDGKNWFVHRLSYFLATGREPDLVRHHCDNPPCFEPTHLAEGSPMDNVLDRDSRGRGRGPRGEESGHAKLTWDSVREIRASREPIAALAARYGVSKACISLARNHHTWKE